MDWFRFLCSVKLNFGGRTQNLELNLYRFEQNWTYHDRRRFQLLRLTVHLAWLKCDSLGALRLCFMEMSRELYRFYCCECTIHTSEKHKSMAINCGVVRSLYDSVINSLLVIFLRWLRLKKLHLLCVIK